MVWWFACFHESASVTRQLAMQIDRFRALIAREKVSFGTSFFIVYFFTMACNKTLSDWFKHNLIQDEDYQQTKSNKIIKEKRRN